MGQDSFEMEKGLFFFSYRRLIQHPLHVLTLLGNLQGNDVRR